MIPCADRRNQPIRQFDDMSDGLLNLGKDTSNLFRDRHGASIYCGLVVPLELYSADLVNQWGSVYNFQ